MPAEATRVMNPRIETRHGAVRGQTADGIAAFLGIPYARPPIGSRRLRPPEPPVPWPGERDAVTFGPVPPQRLFPKIEGMPFASPDLGAPLDEDCLYLNVWTPACDAERRPVMVWIPGGGFVLGAGSLQGQVPANLARRDIVVVSFNYRLGVLGFAHFDHLCGGALGEACNLGLQDQLAALAWVRNNIEAFGGDPSNVTIFGVSAGGMSVGTLLGVPRARGLFHRAAAQSGAAHNAHDRETADRVVEGILHELGLTVDTAEKILELPVDQIVEAQERYYDLVRDVTWPGPYVDPERTSARWAMAYQPVIDGTLLPASPLHAVRSGAGAGVPLIVGTTLHDQKGSEYVDARCPRDDPALLAAIQERVPGRAADGRSNADRVAAAYPWPADTRPDAASAFSAIETHRLFRIPALRLAEANARFHPTFSYLFTWTSPLALIGAGHGLDIPFLLGCLSEPGMEVYAGTGPEAEQLSEQMQAAWVAFARDGDPSTPELPWPQYGADERLVMELGRSSGAFPERQTGELAVWHGLL